MLALPVAAGAFARHRGDALGAMLGQDRSGAWLDLPLGPLTDHLMAPASPARIVMASEPRRISFVPFPRRLPSGPRPR